MGNVHTSERNCVANPQINTLSLCSGVGMLDVGFHAGLEHLGIASRVVAYAEWDAYAAAQLVALVEAGCLDAAPVWCGDLGRLDGTCFRGRVDAIFAGFPCQPHSVAGKREGTDDARWIWPAIVGIIRDSGAWLVVLENVRGLLSSGGMAPVLADLADLGFAAEWTVLGAGEVGASHRRERVFIVGIKHGFSLVYPSSGGGKGSVAQHQSTLAVTESDANAMRPSADDVADSAPGRFRELRQSSGRDGQPDGGDPVMADARHEPGRSQQQVAVCRCGSAPDDCVCGEGLELADREREGWRSAAVAIESRRRPLAEQGGARRGECGGDALGRPEFVGERMAESGSAGLSRGGYSSEPTGRQEQDGHAGLESGILFAPGPSDPRWPGIIAAAPWLAPALGAERKRLNPYFCEWLMGWPIGWSGEHGTTEATDREDQQGGCLQESASRGIARWRELLRLRLTELVGPPSFGLLETGGRSDSMSPVPSQARRGGWDMEVAESGNRAMPNLQDGISTEANQASEVVRQPGMSAAERDHQCAEAMENRRDRLRAVGNGVSPLQAAAAIVALVTRLKG